MTTDLCCIEGGDHRRPALQRHIAFIDGTRGVFVQCLPEDLERLQALAARRAERRRNRRSKKRTALKCCTIDDVDDDDDGCTDMTNTAASDMEANAASDCTYWHAKLVSRGANHSENLTKLCTLTCIIFV